MPQPGTVDWEAIRRYRTGGPAIPRETPTTDLNKAIVCHLLEDMIEAASSITADLDLLRTVLHEAGPMLPGDELEIDESALSVRSAAKNLQLKFGCTPKR